MTDLLPRVRDSRGVSQYDVALRALAAAKDLSEVMGIADKAVALKEYARRAQDRTAEMDAAELRVRAERRVGEIIAGQIVAGRPPGKEDGRIPLREIGITRNFSSHAQKLAKIETQKFEKNLESWRKITASSTSTRNVRLPFAKSIPKKRDSAGVTEYLRHDGVALPELQMRQLAHVAKVIDAILSRRIGYDARSKVKELFGTAQLLEFIAAAEGKTP